MSLQRFNFKGAGVGEILNSDEVRAFLTPKAEAVLRAAQNDPHDETGEYEARLRIDQDTTDRVAVRVVAGDRKGHILEAKYGILNRALDAAG